MHYCFVLMVVFLYCVSKASDQPSSEGHLDIEKEMRNFRPKGEVGSEGKGLRHHSNRGDCKRPNVESLCHSTAS